MNDIEAAHGATPFQDQKFLEKATDVDDAILRAQGREAQLKRSFSWIGALGLAFSATNSWLGYASCFGLDLAYGGGSTAVFGLVIGAAVQWIVLLGLAEMCSAFPSSGGQYHFTYILAPRPFRSFAAYTVGMINIISWWVTTASGTFLTAISAFGIAKFWHPDFVSAQWQVYLCYVLVIIMTLIPIFTVPHRHIDYLTKTCMFLSVVGFVLVLVVSLVMGRGTYHPSNLVDYRGNSGWSPGPAWMMSIGIGEYAFAAAGACTHIAEEIPRPSRRVPLVINLTMLVGAVTAFPWILSAVSLIQDTAAVQNSFLPSLELFYQAAGNKGVAVFLQAYLTLLYYSCIPSQWITSSRIAWAFSRDNGLPFSRYWSHIHPKYDIPVRTTLLSAFVCLLYGLLYIASTRAFNSIINTAVLMLNITYTVPQGILATCGRNRLPRRPFNLGVYGYAVNMFSVLWLVVSGVFFCFPSTYPTTVVSMNYSAVVLVGIFSVVLLLWIERRKKFSGPVIDWDALNASNS